MKTLIITLLLITGALAFSSNFCKGFKEGYKQGYCQGKVSCLSPLTPLCPVPGLGEKTYMDGYNRGFIEGLNAR